jgi:glycosyltransferase involved in cell wall biosynthesis
VSSGPIIDIIIPARDEECTVAANVVAALGCAHVREVLVVDDGSSDHTGDEARAAGAKVIRRESEVGSKAHAMALGVAATDADTLFFIDADCTGLTSAHLDAICEPYLAGRCVMSLGAFDYGWFWNPMVLRWPPLTGERIVPRRVFESIPPDKISGYTIEVRINEVVAESRMTTVARTMPGVYHRTKRDKLGRIPGLRATWAMYMDLFGLLKPGEVRWRTYWFYLHGLTVHRHRRRRSVAAPAEWANAPAR